MKYLIILLLCCIINCSNKMRAIYEIKGRFPNHTLYEVDGFNTWVFIIVDSSNNIIYIADCNELTNKFYKIKNIQ